MQSQPSSSNSTSNSASPASGTLSGRPGAVTRFIGWLDARVPLTEVFEYHMSKYHAPKNFNVLYYFGVLSMVVLVNQLLTGIWLTMTYVPSTRCAMCSWAG